MCEQYKVQYYPTMRLGLAPDFAGAHLEGLAEVKGRSVREVVGAVAKHLDT